MSLVEGVFLCKCIFFGKIVMMYNAHKTQFPLVLKNLEGVSICLLCIVKLCLLYVMLIICLL